MSISKKHLCDECGRQYFSSCHECIHASSLVVGEINRILGKMPLTKEFAELRRKLEKFREFSERKFMDLNHA